MTIGVNRQPVTALAAEFEHNLAIVVGINAYTYMRKLKTARPDAERLARLLQDQRRDLHDRYEVIALYDEDASSSALSALLFETVPVRVRQLGQRTRVLFYFAGHGDAETSEDELTVKGFLFPQDAKAEDASTLLAMDKVQDALTGLDCQHVLLIVDCCSAGALTKPQITRSALRPVPLYWDYLQRYVARKARQVITSAAHNQQALDVDPRYKVGVRDEGDGGNHSPFAQALFEALDPGNERVDPTHEAGRKGVVTATDLYLHIRETLYQKVGDSQTPGLWTVAEKGHDQGEYVFLLPGTRLELEPAPDLSKDEYNPWPGLVAYNQDQAELFAGRDQVIQELTQRVEAQPLVVVTGPSSAGKTSLVQAGLLPWLGEKAKGEQGATTKRWRILPPLSLGEMPLPTLGQFLAAQLSQTVTPAPADAFGRDPSDLANLVTSWLYDNPNQRLLLTLDTREVLFEEGNKEQRDRLWPLLMQAAQHDKLHVVLTVRSNHWSALPALLAEARFERIATNREDLREVVEQPAAARMVYLASKDLVDRLVDDAEGQPAALPLLSETLHRMYLRYAEGARQGLRTDRTLTQEDYDAVGGLGGVAAGLAEAFYDQQSDDARRLTMQHVLMRLVDVDEGRYVRRRAQEWEFAYPDPQATVRGQAVIAGLAERGLVVLGAAAGQPYVELGHADLTKDGQRLNTWLVDNGAEWGLQRELTAQVGRWMPEKPKADLWDDNPKLSQAQEEAWPTREKQQGLAARLRREWGVLAPKKQISPDTGWLNQTEVDFVRASVNERARIRQRLFVAVAAFVVILMVATAIALVLRDVAVKAEATAVAKQAEAEREARRSRAGELAASANERMQALGYVDDVALILARDAVNATNAVTSTQKFVLQNASEAMVRAVSNVVVPVTQLPVHRHTHFVVSVAWSPDGTKLATASLDGTAKIWSVADGDELISLMGHTDDVHAVAWSPDGGHLVTASKDGAARVWDTATGLTVLKLDGHSGSVNSAMYSPDGQRIVTAGEDGRAIVWSAATGKALRDLSKQMDEDPMILLGHTYSETLNVAPYIYALHAATWSPDGRRIATAGGDGRTIIWDAATGKRLLTLTGHIYENSVAPAASPDAIFESRGDPLIAYAVNSTSWSPDGRRIVTASNDGTAIVWDAVAGLELVKLTGHEEPVNAAIWSPEDERIVTVSDDQTARVWNPTTGDEILLRAEDTYTQVNQYEGTAMYAIEAAAWSPDGHYIATGSQNGTAEIWEATTGKDRLALAGHAGSVYDAAWSPDGTRIASAGEDFGVKIWDVTTATELHTLTGHSGSVGSVQYSPNGRRILTASDDGTARIWDSTTGYELLALNGQSGFVSARWDPMGERIVTIGDDGSVWVWDAATAAQLLELPHDTVVNAADWSPDGLRIATVGDDGSIRIWAAHTGREVSRFAGNEDVVLSVAWDPTGQMLATAGWDGVARVWDVATQAELITLEGHMDSVGSVAWSPDGPSLVTASLDETALVWSAETGAVSFVLASHAGAVNSAVWSPNGQSVATASEDGIVRIWKVSPKPSLLVLGGQTYADFPGQPISINSASWDQQGKHILTAHDDGTVTVWNAATGTKLLTIGAHTYPQALDLTGAPYRELSGPAGSYVAYPVNSVAWSPDGQRFATASDDQTAKVWEADSGNHILTLSPNDGAVNAVSWSPDGKLVATAHEGHYSNWVSATGTTSSATQDNQQLPIMSYEATITIWDAETGAKRLGLGGHLAGIRSVDWSRDSRQIVTGSLDGTARVWNTVTGENLLTLRGRNQSVYWAAFNPQGTRIVTAGSEAVADIWDSATGELLLTLYGHTEPIYCAIYSPDGKYVVTTDGQDYEIDETGVIKVWDAATGKELLTLSGHRSVVRSAAYSADGRYILTASEDGTARVWWATPELWVAQLEDKIQRNTHLLLGDERRSFGYDSTLTNPAVE